MKTRKPQPAGRRLRSAGVGAVAALVLGLTGAALSQVKPPADSAVRATDSLKVALIDMDIEKARLAASRSSLFARLIPKVTLSASIGMSEVLFPSSYEAAAFILPRDAYRVTFSLSLSEVFNTKDHQMALLDLEKLRVEGTLARLAQEEQYGRHRNRASALREELALLEEQLALLQAIVTFDTLLFQEGSIKYDTLARARLQVLAMKERICRLRLELQELSAN